MALAPTSASAGGFSGRITIIITTTGVMAIGFGFGIGGGGGYDGCYVTRRVLTPFGFRWRTVNVCY